MYWEFSGDNSDLLVFLVEVDGEEAKRVLPCEREAIISDLQPSVSHSIQVSAVFKDERKTGSQIAHYTIPTEAQSE